MQYDVEEVERLAAEQIVDTLQEIRDNIKAQGRAEAMDQHVRLMLMMMMIKPEAVAVMQTILMFKFAELTARREE